MDLHTWLSTWLELYVVPAGLAPSTIAMYRRAVAAVPLDLLKISVEDLNVSDLIRIRKWQLERMEKTPRAAQLDRVMITRAIKKGQAIGLIPRGLDIAEALPHIQHHAARAEVFTREQLRQYMEAAAVWAGRDYVLLLLLACGLRRGEALGARRDAWAPPVLMISGQRVRVAGVYEWRPPKTEAGRRAVILPDWIAAEVTAACAFGQSEWIVDTTPEELRSAHLRTLEAAGLPAVTLHGLRHTFAALAATQGESMKQLQAALGHAKYQLTADLYAEHQIEASPLPARVLSRVV